MDLQRIFSGAVWITGATVIGRLAGFVSQFALGWILTKQDFGTYAILLSLAVTVSAFRNGGTHQYLIHKGADYDALAPSVLSFSFAFNLFAAVCLVLISFLASDFYNTDKLIFMALLMGFAIFFSSPGLILRANLAINGRFRELSLALAASDIFRQLFVVSLALLGAGVYSFVIPLVSEPLFLFGAFFYWVREFPKPKLVSAASYLAIFKETRWIMLSNLAIALRLNGQYLAISLFEDKLSLGVFFFGSQLVTSVTSMVSMAVNEVVFPSLAGMNREKRNRQKMGAVLIKLAAVLGSMIAVAVMIVAPALVNYLWQNKWNDSIELIQILSAAIPAIIIAAIIFAELAAEGRWGMRLVVMIFAALGEFVVAALVAYAYGIWHVAVGLVAFRWFVVFFLLISNTKVANTYLDSRFFAWITFCAILIAVSLLAYFHSYGLIRLAIQLGVFISLCCLAGVLFWSFRSASQTYQS